MHIKPLDLSPEAVTGLQNRFAILHVTVADCEEWDHYTTSGWYIDANLTCNAIPFGPYPTAESAATAYQIGLRLLEAEHLAHHYISGTEADSEF